MLKGIDKNFNENYHNLISLKRKDQLKTKEDTGINEAFELYMLKNYFKIKLNPLCEKILNFWNKDFDKVFSKHLDYLTKNLENQINIIQNFQLIQQMEVFDVEDNEEQEQTDENEQDNNPENDDNSESNNDENSKEEESEQGAETDYDVNEFRMDNS